MTIINPKQTHRSFINPILCAMLILIILGAASTILMYNRTVDLTHAITEQKKIMEQIQTKNAFLVNKLYQALDIKTLNALAREQGFIKITSPQYLAQH